MDASELEQTLAKLWSLFWARVRHQSLPRMSCLHLAHQDDVRFLVERNDVVDAERVVREAALNDVPEMKSLLDLIRYNELFRRCFLKDAGKIVTDEMEEVKRVQDLLFHFLTKCITRTISGVSADQAPHDVFLDSVKPMLTDYPTTIMIAPILRTALPMEEVVLDADFRIRAVTMQEIERWINSRLLDWVPVNELSIVIEAVAKDDNPRTVDLVADHIYRTLPLCLRLVSGRQVVVPFLEYTVNRPQHPVYRSSIDRDAFIPVPLAITQEMADSLRTVFCRVKEMPSWLSLALKRWDVGMMRLRHEDRLIDYWVALESLLTPDARTEIGYRASLRGAVLATGRPADRLRLYRLLLESYDCRSSIVHGGSIRKNLNLKVMVGETGECLRALLLKAVTGSLEESHVGEFEKRLLSTYQPD